MLTLLASIQVYKPKPPMLTLLASIQVYKPKPPILTLHKPVCYLNVLY